ncbi:MAG: T9SS type A sorting domain-containing protein [Saprospiraceae bacterium]|nr:T9SS type A sorting domain-containing protein [Saprospiraceae bacterium]
MNIKKYLFLSFVLILSLFSNSLFGACEIFDLTILKTDCNQNNKFAVKLNFGYHDVSDCFTVKGNGKEYGPFFYSKLPIIIDGLPGDCTTVYEFQIVDCNNKQCTSVSKELGKVCCPNPADCKIYDLRYEKLPCDTNDNFFVIINFGHQNSSTCFKLKINDRLYQEYKYSDLPIKVGPLEGDCATERAFTVFDCEKPDCIARVEMPKVCCNEPCKISDLKIERTACDTNHKFFAILSFKAQGVSDSFFIKGNGKVYGKYKYGSTSYKVGPLLGDCVTKYGFAIIDHKNTNCGLDTTWGTVCCDTPNEPCKLYDLIAERTECNADNQFYVVLNFKSKNASECFRVKGNGNDYGEFKYTSLPIKLGPFHGDCITEYEFIMQDCKDIHCSLEKFIGKVCCPPSPEPCKLSELVVEKSDCNQDNQFYLHLNFKANNASECFKVFLNGAFLGEFPYASLPLKIGPFPGDCKTEYKLLVKDCKDPHCNLEKNIGIVCCLPNAEPCKLSELLVERTECNADNQFYVFFKFDFSNASECFHIRGNGKDYGEFRYANLPIKLGPFEGDCTTEYEFVIQDCKDPHCSLEKFIGKVCCGTQEPCKFSDLVVEKSDCNADNQFYLQLNFKANNTSDCFKVFINGNPFGPYLYASLPLRIGPFPGDCKTEYKLLIQDCKDSHCGIDKYIGKVCCGTQEPCKLSELNITKTDCEGERKFYAILNFQHSGTSGCFKVKGNGHYYGEFNYSHLPIKIGPLTADCNTNYEFVVFDCNNEACRVSGNLGKVCCEPGDAHFYELLMVRSDCEPDSTFRLKFDFKYRNVSDSFLISVNGKPEGTFSYTKLPVSIGPLKADCKTIYKILLIDQKDTLIRAERFIERPCCRPKNEPCKIFEVKATPLHCTGPNEYALKIDFKTQGITNAYFDVYDRLGPIGFFSFSQLPVTINNFKKSGRDFDFIKICENDNPACCTPIEFHTIDCITSDPKKFSISNVIVNNSSNTVSIFSELEIPADVELELFNLEGKQIEIHRLESGPHEILISTEGLSTNAYFLRLKNQETVKTYKFFHLR